MKRTSIVQAFFRSNLLISFVTVLLSFGIGILFVVYGYRQGRDQAIQSYLEQQRNGLQAEVHMVAEFFRKQNLEAEGNVRNELRSWVDRQYAILQSFYEQTPQRNRAEAKYWAVTALKPLRFPMGNTPLLAHGANGKILYNPLLDSLLESPSLPDSSRLHIQAVISEFERQMEKGGQGFHTYRWWKPGIPGMEQLKTTYLRTFTPFRLCIGASVYHSDLDSAMQQNARASLSSFHFGEHGSLFIVDNHGNILQPNALLAKASDGARIATSSQGFVTLDNKLFYLQPLAQWNWSIGLGIRLDKIDALSRQHRASFHLKLWRLAYAASLTILALLGLATLLSYYNTRRVQKSIRPITQAFHEAETNLTPISPDSISLDEFRQIAQSANQLMEARSRIDQEREALLHQIDERSHEFEQILYIASHDLRAPLVNLHGFTAELGEDIKEIRNALENPAPPNPEKWEALRKSQNNIQASFHYIEASTERMERLLKGLLAYSRLGRIEPQTARISMNTLIQDIRSGLEFRLREQHAVVHMDPLPDCYADPLLVQQIFQNILDNALKYSRPGKQPVVQIQGELHNRTALYSIQDNGIGIAPTHLPKLFDLFYRANPNGNIKGEGIGLALAQRMVRRMHGRIRVESEPGQGTTFHIELPGAVL